MINFDAATLIGANLSGRTWVNALFTTADMRYADLSNADLQYTSFKRTDLTNVNITGVKWSYVECPDQTVTHVVTPDPQGRTPNPDGTCLADHLFPHSRAR